MRIMWKPKYFHEMTTNIVNITMERSASHSWTRKPSPAVPRPRSTMPSG